LKVFVTGAGGFIGRALLRQLVKQGDEVIALVRKSVFELPKEVRLVYGDILAPDSWKGSVSGCQILYHLAAFVSFDPRQRRQLQLVNAKGTEEVLKAACCSNVATTVVVSSACTLGLSYEKDKLLDETSAADKKLIDHNPYLESKLLQEGEALIASKRQRVVIVNPTTVYGPGDWSLNSGTLIKQVAGSIFLPVPSGGSNTVDVEDVAGGIILAARRGSSGQRYVIGGQNLTFQEIFQVISQAVRRKPIFIPLASAMRFPLSLSAGIFGRLTNSRFITPQIINDMFIFKYYSTELAESCLGFKKRYSFQETIQRALGFYRENNLLTI